MVSLMAQSDHKLLRSAVPPQGLSSEQEKTTLFTQQDRIELKIQASSWSCKK